MPTSLTRLAARLLSRAVRPSGHRHRAIPQLMMLEDRVTPSGTPAWAAGAAPGAEPRVWVYDSANLPVRDFLAYEPTFTGGVRTSLADLNADGVPDIVTGAGPGGGPRVRTFDGASGAEMANFFAYDPSFTGGVWVSAGPVSATANGIATGADAGGGPDVRVFSAAGVNIRGFFAYDPASTGGVRVALGRTAAGASVYAATGAGLAPTVTGFDVATGGKTFAVAAGGSGDTSGVFVAAGDLRPGGVEEVVTVAGPAGQPAAVRVFAGSDGSVLNQGTLPHSAGTVGVVRWAGQRAVVVAVGGGASAYGFPSVGDGPSYLGAHSVDGGDGGGDVEVGGGGVRTQSEGSEYIERLDNQMWWAAQDPGAYARVTSVVSEAEVDGKAAFKWWYEVDNASVDWIDPNYNPDDPPTGLAGVSIIGSYHQSTPLGSPQNDWGWDNYPGSFSNGGLGDGAHWLEPSLGDYGGYVYVGDVAHFWYFTEPIPIVTGSGEFFSGQIAGGGGGKVLVPGPKPTVSATFATDLIPVNANNHNWKPPAGYPSCPFPDYGRWTSDDQQYIPAIRDFDAVNLWQDDTDLVPVTITVGGGLAGTVGILDVELSDGDVEFWVDRKKTARFTSKAVAAGAPPFTIYAEGKHESSQLQDVYVATFFTPTATPAAWVADLDRVSVTPVLRGFTHRIGSPTITFAGAGKPADGSTGITTEGWPDADGKRPNGIEFELDAVTGSFGNNNVGFLQNQLSITNGFNTPTKTGPGQTFFNPVGQRDLKLTQQAIDAGGAFPLLDANPGAVLYPGNVLANGKFFTSDSPEITWGAALGSKITRMDIMMKFTMYFVIVFDDLSVYSIASCDWSVNFLATSDAPNQPLLKHIPADAKVTSAGWVRSNANPEKTRFPVSNEAVFLH